MSALESTTELGNLLETWANQNDSAVDPLPLLTRIAEIVEKETEAYLKMDPDPFDDRHPGRADPACSLGHVLKALFKNDDFMNKLVNNYILHRDNRELSTAACRLLLDIMPGLETSVVFQDTEGLVPRLFQWAENGSEPLRSYSTGLLAAAMEIQDLAANFRDHNCRLVPLMLKRLHELSKFERPDPKFTIPNFRGEVLESQAMLTPHRSGSLKMQSSSSTPSFQYLDEDAITDDSLLVNSKSDIKSPSKVANKICTSFDVLLQTRSDSHISPFSSPKHHPTLNENSNSSWAEMEPFVIGQHQMFPLTKKMQQRLILQYLTPMGEYQEFLGYVFEHNALALILHYINLHENKDVRLAFEALKYLAALLCHKKFAIEFIAMKGLLRLLEVHRPSIAATGVSMCLYYLAYSGDAMDRVCQLPEYVLKELVSYALWLLECSHESGRCHATMFFGLSFPYQVIIESFDAQDGLRKLFNVISTLEILSVDDLGAVLNDDAIFASRQTARHVCVALKRYYETHLAIKADRVGRSRSQGNYVYSIPAYKALKITPELVRENLEFLLTHLALIATWEPVDELHKLSGITLLLQLIAMTLEWNYSGRAETVRSALDVLSVCAVMPKIQLTLGEPVKLPEDANPVGMNILLGAAKGEIISDPDVQRAALNVIINCVCGPTYRLGASCSRVTCSNAKKKPLMRSAEEILKKMWHCVQGNNGIMVLLNLLMVQTPITDADSIRALACRALVGLSRSESVKQIISKLPIFGSGQLQILMKEPVLQDKLRDHRIFIKHALELIEKVSGKSLTVGVESSISKINKADVVAQTKIIYHQKQLLQLIHQHLLSQGFNSTAVMLQKEAELPPGPPRLVGISGYTITPKTLLTPPQSKISRHVHSSPTLHTCLTVGAHPHTPNIRTAIGTPTTSGSSNASTSTTPASNGILNGPIRVSLAAHKPPSLLIERVVQRTFNRPSTLEKSQTGSCYQQSPVMKRQSLQGVNANSPAYSTVQLDNIVTEYLRKQHALCKNPVITCPPFDLFVPHSCPDPKFRNCAPTNFTARFQRRPLFPRFGGVDGSKMDRRLIFSRFRPVRVFKEAENMGRFTCCSFTACDQMIALGTHTGDLKLYNVQTGQEEASYTCHDSALTYCGPSRDGRLMLTSSAWLPPLSALWGMTERFDMLHSFQEDHYVEFSKLVQDRIVGTKDNIANIYDVSTGQRLMVLKDADMSNNYTKNRATFSPTDELVLSDGVLWDLLSGKPVHKFDKFNPHISGVFHPNGLEVVANSEIWDLRTFHLLHTVPALDQCHVTFNHQGNIMYGAMHTSGEDELDMEEEQLDRPFGSSFRTFDATDYSNIATIDVKKNICDLCTDKADCYLTVIENMAGREVISAEAVCRLYEIGRLRDEDDEMEEDDDDAEEDDMATDDEDDDDDDDDDENDDDNAENEGEQNDDDDNNDVGDESLDGSISDDFDDEEDFDDDVLFAINAL